MLLFEERVPLHEPSPDVDEDLLVDKRVSLSPSIFTRRFFSSLCAFAECWLELGWPRTWSERGSSSAAHVICCGWDSSCSCLSLVKSVGTSSRAQYVPLIAVLKHCLRLEE